MAKAMVSTVRPKAKDTPSNPIPTSGKAAARTADPQPPRTSHSVPMNSAASFGAIFRSLPVLPCVEGSASALPFRKRYVQGG